MKAIATPLGHVLTDDTPMQRPLSFTGDIAPRVEQRIAERKADGTYRSRGQCIAEVLKELAEPRCPECDGPVTTRCFSCDQAGQ